MSAPASDDVLVASHAILFEEATAPAARCDVCGEAIDESAEADQGYAVTGHGLYVWARSDGVHYEEAPLCASCGTAIGVMAFAQWDIEEEEG